MAGRGSEDRSRRNRRWSVDVDQCIGKKVMDNNLGGKGQEEQGIVGYQNSVINDISMHDISLMHGQRAGAMASLILVRASPVVILKDLHNLNLLFQG